MADLQQRLRRSVEAARTAGLDALLVTPGPDLRYLTGYDAIPLERLTCLLVPAAGEIRIIVPELELPAALASPIGELGLDVVTWQETDDPYALAARLLPGAARVAVDDHMWAAKVLALREAMPAAVQTLAGQVIHELRMRKSPAEIESLLRAGRAIDEVHAQVPGLLRPGRTEREVGRDIADAILAAGHATVDFVIVASGPNGASPHHELSDRVLQAGDTVVVDIGGSMPDGYCSDSTRMYALGEPSSLAREECEVLRLAQIAAVAAVRPGVTCESIDAVARDYLADAGLGAYFVHRTGHGIGLETHEEPYIVAGNRRILEPGMAFSVEPGVYRPGSHGARIEDIVVCTDEGVLRCNNQPHEMVIVE
ncbi:MAG TPA: Xaa-Pro peptidase family protein [Actinomycetota bacterium]|nr:Xaa-Pro peptidase family protein [Actinomycetota bacterium]